MTKAIRLSCRWISQMSLLKVQGGIVLLSALLLINTLAPAQSPSAPGGPASTPPPLAAPSQNDLDQRQPPPIIFESHGLEYESITKGGITVMFAPLPVHVSDYNIVQATVTNGSLVSWTVRASDFTFIRQDGTVLHAVSPDEVVANLLRKAGRTDVIKLQLLYEQSIYAIPNYHSTNGYEQRREAAMAQFVNKGFKAAAEASAIIFENRTRQKGLGPGRFIAHTCGEFFVFEVYTELKSK